jgi:hypothetical protein
VVHTLVMLLGAEMSLPLHRTPLVAVAVAVEVEGCEVRRRIEVDLDLAALVRQANPNILPSVRMA